VAGTDRRVQVLSTHADYRPLAAWTFFGQYAGKWVREKFEAEPVRYHAHLWAARATYDVTSRVDVGSLASVLWDSSQVGTRKAFGAELGVLLRADTWLSVGYNLTGFSDRDLRDVLNDGYTTRGAYVRLKVKFDESLFTARRRARGARAPGR